MNGQQEFYLPHKALICENAERTNLKIVYDASARENSKSLLLNSCLETGPALQNVLWSVLIGASFKVIALCADLQKAFLQICIKKKGRDALRFYWVRRKRPHSNRSSSIYKTWVCLSAISVHTRRKNRRTYKQLHKEVSC